MAPSKNHCPLLHPPPQQDEDESSCSSSSNRKVEVESDVEEKGEKPTFPQNEAASQVKEKQPCIVVDMQTTSPFPTLLLPAHNDERSEDEGSVSSPSASNFIIKFYSPKKPTVNENTALALKPPSESPPLPPKTKSNKSKGGEENDLKRKKKAKRPSENPSTKAEGDENGLKCKKKVKRPSENPPTKPEGHENGLKGKKKAKRPSENPPTKTEGDEDDLRNKKKARTSEEDLKMEKSAEVLCSEEDDIGILKGMIRYRKKKGTDPTVDIAAFHNFVKGNLQAEITETKLYKKIRRLRKKYFKNVDKIEEGEVDFLDHHKTRKFLLSKKIWGNIVEEEEENVDTKRDDRKLKKKGKVGRIAVSSTKKQKRIEKKKDVLEGEIEDEVMDGVLEEEVKDDDKIEKMNDDDEYQLRLEETELLLKKYQLLVEHISLILNAIRK